MGPFHTFSLQPFTILAKSLQSWKHRMSLEGKKVFKKKIAIDIRCNTEEESLFFNIRIKP